MNRKQDPGINKTNDELESAYRLLKKPAKALISENLSLGRLTARIAHGRTHHLLLCEHPLRNYILFMSTTNQ